MKIFAADLDNTLIYSYKRDIGDDKISVEKKDEKILSYMTKKSHKMLKEIKFIPITARSLEQYKRIKFFENFEPEYAITTNGSILLHNGKICKEWYKSSLELAEISEAELKKGIKLLSEDENVYLEIKKVDNFFIFTKSRNPEETKKNLFSYLDTKLVDIHSHNEKIYILPKNINKGTALKRLKKFLKADKIICAGDSEMDISMLNSADISIFPENLKNFISNEKKEKFIVPENEIFSDTLLKKVKFYLKD